MMMQLSVSYTCSSNDRSPDLCIENNQSNLHEFYVHSSPEDGVRSGTGILPTGVDERQQWQEPTQSCQDF